MLVDMGYLVSTCVLTAGGIGGIIVTIVKFSSNSIADHLAKKYELKLSKEMERYKASIENKIYISKTKFDTEFAIYRSLSKVFTQMTKETLQLFPTFTKDARDDIVKYKKQHDKVIDLIVAAQDELYASAPFITENIYNEFLDLEDLCKKQLTDFQDFRIRPDADEFRRDCNKDFRNAYKRTQEIDKKFNYLLSNIRKYITSIDVIE